MVIQSAPVKAIPGGDGKKNDRGLLTIGVYVARR
jgi:hypothetical protein